MSEEEEEVVMDVSSDEIADLLSSALVIPPATIVGGHIFTGNNPGLVTDAVITTMELLALIPSPDGDEFAILTLVLDPALAASLGLNDTTPLETS